MPRVAKGCEEGRGRVRELAEDSPFVEDAPIRVDGLEVGAQADAELGRQGPDSHELVEHLHCVLVDAAGVVDGREDVDNE